MKSDIQEKLAEMGGFVWHVEMWPNWLQVSVDALGNNETDTLLGREVTRNWADQHEEKLQEMFTGLLGEQFGEIAVLGRQMGPEPPYGSCCRLGCGGCMNGAKGRLLDKVQDTNAPIDRVG